MPAKKKTSKKVAKVKTSKVETTASVETVTDPEKGAFVRARFTGL